MKMINRKKQSQKGFTLIELIMSITLASVIALIVAPLLAVGIDAISFHLGRANLEESSNVALSSMYSASVGVYMKFFTL